MIQKNRLITGKKSKKSTLIMGIVEPNDTLLKLDNIDYLVGVPNKESIETITSYKSVILFPTKGMDITKTFSFLDLREQKKILKKVKVISIEATSSYVNINEFVDSLGLTDRSVKRELLKKIKSEIRGSAYDAFLSEKEASLNAIGDHAVLTSNAISLRKVISQKALLGIDFLKEGIALLKRGVEAYNPINVILDGKYLSDNQSKIMPIVRSNERLLLGSPTGTGKSYFVKEVLTKRYNKSLIISPFSLVSGELGDADNIAHIDNSIKQHQALAYLKEDNHISITTDKLYNLLNSSFKEEVEKYLAGVGIFIFDEQHIVHQSKNFRGKVVSIAKELDKYMGQKLFLSGTPYYRDLPNYKHIVVSLRAKEKIDYFEDSFQNEAELITHIKETIKTSNVLIYVSTINRANEVTNYLKANKIKVVQVTSRGNIFEGTELTNEELYSLKNTVIVGTSRITTGVNIPTLNTIYQIGTAYNSDTFIQLVARIRGNGKFYRIKALSGNDRYSSVTNKALHILNKALEYQSLTSEGLVENLNKDLVDFNDTKDYHTQFLGIYRNALMLVASKGLGSFNKDKSLFSFNLDKASRNLDEVFNDTETVNFNKFIDRIVINDIQNKGAIEKLNELYNLSFEFVYHQAEREDIEYKRLITDSDLQEKRDQREKQKEKKEELKEAILLKLEDVLDNESIVKSFISEFTDSEKLQLVNDKRLDNPKVIKALGAGNKNIVNNKEKLLRLKFFLIDKKSILNIAINALKRKPYLTIGELSDEVEKLGRLTSRRSAKPFYFFIKDMLDIRALSDRLLIGTYRGYEDGRQLFRRNVLMLTDEGRKQLIQDELKFKCKVNEAVEVIDNNMEFELKIQDDITVVYEKYKKNRV